MNKQKGFALLLMFGLMVIGTLVGMGTTRVVNAASTAANSGCYSAYAIDEHGNIVKNETKFRLCPQK